VSCLAAGHWWASTGYGCARLGGVTSVDGEQFITLSFSSAPRPSIVARAVFLAAMIII
jgi:hypothetical protein